MKTRLALLLGRLLGWDLHHMPFDDEGDRCGYCRLGVPIYLIELRWRGPEVEDLSEQDELYCRHFPDGAGVAMSEALAELRSYEEGHRGPVPVEVEVSRRDPGGPWMPIYRAQTRPTAGR